MNGSLDFFCRIFQPLFGEFRQNLSWKKLDYFFLHLLIIAKRPKNLFQLNKRSNFALNTQAGYHSSRLFFEMFSASFRLKTTFKKRFRNFRLFQQWLVSFTPRLCLKFFFFLPANFVEQVHGTLLFYYYWEMEKKSQQPKEKRESHVTINNNDFHHKLQFASAYIQKDDGNGWKFCF